MAFLVRGLAFFSYAPDLQARISRRIASNIAKLPDLVGKKD